MYALEQKRTFSRINHSKNVRPVVETYILVTIKHEVNKVMEKKLIAIDMDGTLIGENGVSEEDREAILTARDAGHIVVIVSGRSHESILELLAEIELADLPISGSNGAITLVDGKEISRVSMSKSLVQQVVNYLDDFAYPFLIYTSTGVYSKVDFLDRVREAFATSTGVVGSPFETYEFMAEYSKNHGVIHYEMLSEIFAITPDIFKIFVFLPDPKKKEVCTNFMLSLDDVTLTSSYVDNISVSSANGHKGTGVLALANHFGIPLAHTIAIGDNLNDLEMLKIAGLSIAMENAEPAVKDAADVITLSNLQSGVARAIKQYVLVNS